MGEMKKESYCSISMLDRKIIEISFICPSKVFKLQMAVIVPTVLSLPPAFSRHGRNKNADTLMMTRGDGQMQPATY